MGGMSTYLKNKLLDAWSCTQYTKPTNVYMALYSAAPDADGGGTELSGNGYARVTILTSTGNWPAASGGLKTNGAAIQFAAATGAWSTATHWGLFDASTSGNLLWFGALDTGVAAVEGSVLRFAAGEIDIAIS